MKLRPRIALVSCVVALSSVAVTGALLIRQSRAYSQRELLHRQRLLVENRAFALGDSIDAAARELTRLSHMAEVDLTDNDLRPEATLLAHAHRNSTFFNIGLQIVDAAGRCLWSEPASQECPGASYSETPWFVAGRRASGPVVTGDRSPGILDLVVPIGGTPGAADGVLRGVIDLRSDKIVSPSLTASLPTGTEAALVTSEGDVVVPTPLTRTAGWDKATSAAPSEDASAFVVDEAGVPYLYAHAPVPHARWGLVFRWPYRTLDVGLERQVHLLIVILALGGALAIGLGVVSARFLTRPIEELLGAVRALAHSRTEGAPVAHDAPEAARRDDELGELARAFVDFRTQLAHGDEVHREDLDRIRELASSLEERVRARTAELVAAQTSLVAQERLAAVGRAAAVISHELKNSLNALGMGFDLIAAETGGLPNLTRVSAQVGAEVNRLRAMVDELLVFTRAPVVDPQPTDLNQLVRGTIELCAEQAASAGVAVSTKLAGDGAPLVVRCDAERIRSILVNLLQNAIEAVAWASTPAPRREVVVATEPGGGTGYAAIAVDDSGPGVPAEAKARLFEPFFTTKRNGTGLGLATSQRFAAAHGGRIDLQASSGLGGARFVVRIPESGAGSAAERAA